MQIDSSFLHKNYLCALWDSDQDCKTWPLCALPEPADNNAVQGVRKVPDAMARAGARLCWRESQSHNAERMRLVQGLEGPARMGFGPTPGFFLDVFGTKFPQPIPVRTPNTPPLSLTEDYQHLLGLQRLPGRGRSLRLITAFTHLLP